MGSGSSSTTSNARSRCTFVASSLAQTVCIQQIGMSDAKSAHALLYSFRTGLSSGQGQKHTGSQPNGLTAAGLVQQSTAKHPGSHRPIMFSMPYTAPTKWLWSMASLPPVPTWYHAAATTSQLTALAVVSRRDILLGAPECFSCGLPCLRPHVAQPVQSI